MGSCLPIEQTIEGRPKRLMPTISFLMPVKNGEEFIKETIESIQRQDFSDWELIIVDDFSTDQTVNLVHSIQDNRIRIVQNQIPGIIQALSLALSKATGNYVTRIDCDDLLPVKRLSLMMKTILECNKSTLVTGLVKYFSSGEISPGYMKYENWINTVNLEGSQYKNMYRECVIASPNWLCDRNTLIQIGGFTGLNYPEDYDLIFRWYEHGFTFRCVPEITLFWREHPNRTSRTSSNYNQEAFFKLKINRFLQLNYNPKKKLMVWGNNRKAKLATLLLKKSNIPYEKVPLQSSITNQAFGIVVDPKNVQILLAVYPREIEKQTIIQYLNKLELIEGVHFWFL